MRLKNNKRTMDTSKQVSSLQQATNDMETKKDIDYSHMRCLEFMKKYFVDADLQQIFKSIEGPVRNHIEVTFEKKYFDQVREIEHQFMQILASHMTPTSKTKCLLQGPINNGSVAWTPPTVVSIPKNPYAGRRNGPAMALSSTSASHSSYAKAAILGRRQVDQPQVPIPVILTPASMATNSTLTSTTQAESTIKVELQEAQKKFQTDYDQKLLEQDRKLARIDQHLLRIETESKDNKSSITNLGTEMQTKYKELNETIKTTQTKSETRITKSIDEQTRIQTGQNDYHNNLMAIMFVKLGCDPALLKKPEDDTIMHQDDTCPPYPSRIPNPMDLNTQSHIQINSRNQPVVAGAGQ